MNVRDEVCAGSGKVPLTRPREGRAYCPTCQRSYRIRRDGVMPLHQKQRPNQPAAKENR
ncbi:Uncharacterised protein [Mycobacteroides abscessus subsp. massiliense]|nr:Uncharacterised protein [Mycobacteroides abscessus subsp. massiliense]SKR65381.1 Uncharacterised protein [Mycobacteroides abscessus subsp. abscessus]SLH53233.1 Uncharacterised protein [Mycobacteroides abscessus subsp. massiliense]